MKFLLMACAKSIVGILTGPKSEIEFAFVESHSHQCAVQQGDHRGS